MSNHIPIVPSSPPPIDDEWEDGDDFGDFLSAEEKINGIDSNEDKEDIQIPKINGDTVETEESFGYKSIAVDKVTKTVNNFANFNTVPQETDTEGCDTGSLGATLNSSNIQGDAGQPIESDSTEMPVKLAEAICDKNSNHSCNESNEIKINNVENNNCSDEIVTESNQSKTDVQKTSTLSRPGDIKTDQHDATSQGSLTDSGMYSNDVSPAPNSIHNIPDFSDHSDNGDKQCSREQSVSSEQSDPNFPKPQSLDLCSESTSHCSFEEKSEDNPQSGYTETSSSIGSNNEEFESHEEHEESPEPLSFKPASFTEEEGAYFENQDLTEDDNFGQCYEKEFDAVDGSVVINCNTKTEDKTKTEQDCDEQFEVLSNSSQTGQICDDEDSEFNTFQRSESAVKEPSDTSAIETAAAQVIISESDSPSNIRIIETEVHSADETEVSSEVNIKTVNSETLSKNNCDTDNNSEPEETLGGGETGKSDIVESVMQHQCADKEVHVHDDSTELSNTENISCVQESEAKSELSASATEVVSEKCVNEHQIDTEKSEDKPSDEDDFGNFADVGNNSEDDFGGFAEFGEASDVKVAEDTGGWAAFDAGDPGDTEETEDSGWAAFSEPVVPTDKKQLFSDEQNEADLSFGEFDEVVKQDDFEDEDFGGFSSHTETKDNSEKPKKQLDVIGALDKCFCSVKLDKNANEIEEYTEVNLFHVVSKEECMQREVITKQPGQFRESKSVIEVDMNIWKHLKDMENTQGLKFQWTNSNANQTLLKAINIDTRNMLIGHKKPAVPIFASGLGLLEPKMGLDPSLLSQHNTKPTTTSSSPIIDTSKTWAPTSGNLAQDVPPVDFDWKNSILTNPLDEDSTIALDLDFFIQNDTTGSLSTSEAQEKEQAILQALEPSQEKRSKPVQPLENILANMKFTSTLSSTMQPSASEKKLSSRANGVVLQLPDFSFMKARVLMFPIKRSTTTSDTVIDCSSSLNESVGIKELSDVNASQTKDVTQQQEEIIEMF